MLKTCSASSLVSQMWSDVNVRAALAGSIAPTQSGKSGPRSCGRPPMRDYASILAAVIGAFTGAGCERIVYVVSTTDVLDSCALITDTGTHLLSFLPRTYLMEPETQASKAASRGFWFLQCGIPNLHGSLFGKPSFGIVSA